MKKLFLTLLLCCLIPVNAMGLSVYFDPSESILDVGDTFSVDILANIPETEPIIGWGLDVEFDEDVLALTDPPSIGSSWTSLFTPDGDGLAGSTYPLPVTGDGVLLATLYFEVIDYGSTSFIASFNELTEGFSSITGFVDTTFESTNITAPVPEPATMLLLWTGLLGLAGARRKYRKAI